MSWVICDTRGHTCITFTEDDASTNNMYYIMQRIAVDLITFHCYLKIMILFILLLFIYADNK